MALRVLAPAAAARAHGLGPRDILVPGVYRNVVVVLADMCSFSSFMRDTPDAAITRENLTTFYSMARDQIINRGGMLCQFVGDEAIGIFGIPEADDDAPAQALAVARSLHSVGASVAHHWQRHIDRVQPGACTSAWRRRRADRRMALSRTHVGAPDCINVAARLMQRRPGRDRGDHLYRRFSPADREACEIPAAKPRTSDASARGRRASVGWDA